MDQIQSADKLKMTPVVSLVHLTEEEILLHTSKKPYARPERAKKKIAAKNLKDIQRLDFSMFQEFKSNRNSFLKKKKKKKKPAEPKKAIVEPIDNSLDFLNDFEESEKPKKRKRDSPDKKTDRKKPKKKYKRMVIASDSEGSAKEDYGISYTNKEIHNQPYPMYNMGFPFKTVEQLVPQDFTDPMTMNCDEDFFALGNISEEDFIPSKFCHMLDFQQPSDMFVGMDSTDLDSSPQLGQQVAVDIRPSSDTISSEDVSSPMSIVLESEKVMAAVKQKYNIDNQEFDVVSKIIQSMNSIGPSHKPKEVHYNSIVTQCHITSTSPPSMEKAVSNPVPSINKEACVPKSKDKTISSKKETASIRTVNCLKNQWIRSKDIQPAVSIVMLDVLKKVSNSQAPRKCVRCKSMYTCYDRRSICPPCQKARQRSISLAKYPILPRPSVSPIKKVPALKIKIPSCARTISPVRWKSPGRKKTILLSSPVKSSSKPLKKGVMKLFSASERHRLIYRNPKETSLPKVVPHLRALQTPEKNKLDAFCDADVSNFPKTVPCLTALEAPEKKKSDEHHNINVVPSVPKLCLSLPKSANHKKEKICDSALKKLKKNPKPAVVLKDPSSVVRPDTTTGEKQKCPETSVEEDATSESTLKNLKKGLFLWSCPELDKDYTEVNDLPSTKTPEKKNVKELPKTPEKSLVTASDMTNSTVVKDITYSYKLPDSETVLVAHYASDKDKNLDFELSKVYLKNDNVIQSLPVHGTGQPIILDQNALKILNEKASSAKRDVELLITSVTSESNVSSTRNDVSDQSTKDCSSSKPEAAFKSPPTPSSEAISSSTSPLGPNVKNPNGSKPSPQKMKTIEKSECQSLTSLVPFEIEAFSILSIIDIDNNSVQVQQRLEVLIRRQQDELKKLQCTIAGCSTKEVPRELTIKLKAIVKNVQTYLLAKTLWKQYGTLDKIAEILCESIDDPEPHTTEKIKLNNTPVVLPSPFLTQEAIASLKMEKVAERGGCMFSQKSPISTSVTAVTPILPALLQSNLAANELNISYQLNAPVTSSVSFISNSGTVFSGDLNNFVTSIQPSMTAQTLNSANPFLVSTTPAESRELLTLMQKSPPREVTPTSASHPSASSAIVISRSNTVSTASNPIPPIPSLIEIKKEKHTSSSQSSSCTLQHQQPSVPNRNVTPQNLRSGNPIDQYLHALIPPSSSSTNSHISSMSNLVDQAVPYPTNSATLQQLLATPNNWSLLNSQVPIQSQQQRSTNTGPAISYQNIYTPQSSMVPPSFQPNSATQNMQQQNLPMNSYTVRNFQITPASVRPRYPGVQPSISQRVPNQSVPFSTSMNRTLPVSTFSSGGSYLGRANPLRVQQVVVSNVSSSPNVTVVNTATNMHPNSSSTNLYNYNMQSVMNTRDNTFRNLPLPAGQPSPNTYINYPTTAKDVPPPPPPYNVPTNPNGPGGVLSPFQNENTSSYLLPCQVCGKASSMRCKQCGLVVYCGTECAKYYWNYKHKAECQNRMHT